MKQTLAEKCEWLRAREMKRRAQSLSCRNRVKSQLSIQSNQRRSFRDSDYLAYVHVILGGPKPPGSSLGFTELQIEQL